MADEDVVNVYSSRKEALIKPLLDEFSQATGITVNLITGKADALIQRLKSEGRNSPADLLLTSDAGRLHRAVLAGVLQPVASAVLDAAIPASYRDPEGFWYGLTIRARPIMYATDRVDPAELSTYEALSDDKWKRRICIRSSDNIYNQSLVASMIASQGQEKTMAWLEGFVANFALLFNIFLIMGILAQLNAALTLPGIAGIVLTIGMSIDANVLIFERIRTCPQ